MKNMVIFWFRRDLRTEDNTALNLAARKGLPVLPIFIFDPEILDELDTNDARVSFIYDRLTELFKNGVPVLILKGKPLEEIRKLCLKYHPAEVYCNSDYEPYGRQRDTEIAAMLSDMEIAFHSVKDHVVFEKNEVTKDYGKPYTVYTPYKKKFLAQLEKETRWAGQTIEQAAGKIPNVYYRIADPEFRIPPIEELGFRKSSIPVRSWSLDSLGKYGDLRDYPAQDAGSNLGPHLRFGTVSVRKIFLAAMEQDSVFLEELIWREFFMQILWNFPQVVHHNFKRQYDGVRWRNDEEEFRKWCEGQTGYPMVDAGMRELRETGRMHNRVRMITASFLCKHLLIDWRWGEGWFAKHLLDYELASNNGNWQWAAGTGCDAAPYFRVFNPETQQQKFDPDGIYLSKWVPEYKTRQYPQPIVDHKTARERAIETYRQGIIR